MWRSWWLQEKEFGVLQCTGLANFYATTPTLSQFHIPLGPHKSSIDTALQETAPWPTGGAAIHRSLRGPSQWQQDLVEQTRSVSVASMKAGDGTKEKKPKDQEDRIKLLRMSSALNLDLRHPASPLTPPILKASLCQRFQYSTSLSPLSSALLDHNTI